MNPNNLNELMNNPEIMNNVMEMMKDPNMMKNVMGMMDNPEMMNNINNLMNKNGNTSGNTPDIEELDQDNQFHINDKIIINGLNNELYNNKIGIVKNYNSNSNRYTIFIEELDKNIAIKEECLKLLDTVENSPIEKSLE